MSFQAQRAETHYAFNTKTTSNMLDCLQVEVFIFRDIEGGGFRYQMLPTDFRKQGCGGRCSDDLTTLGTADVAVMEMDTGRGN